MSKKAAKGTTMAQDAPKSPRHQTLPGMDGVRHTALDGLCESIAEIREELNKHRQNEAQECQSALEFMKAHRVRTYNFAGVELARVPGTEKLRVRTSKEKATTEVSDDE